MELRDYQIQALEDVHAKIDEGYTRILIHAPTGSGKTVIAAEMTKRAVALGHGVLFLAHRKELIDQAWNKLRTFGVSAGVLMANDPRRAVWEKVCVASVQTLVRRQYKPKAAIIALDECHHAPANSYTEILKFYPDAIVVGLTASPVRTDSRGLGDIFQVMVSCPSVGEMMRRLDPATGKPHLVGTRVFAPPSANLKGVRISRGDYKSDDLAKVCDKPKLVGDIVRHWKLHASGRRTIVFAVGVEHSKHIVAEFVAAGVVAEHLDAGTAKEEREGILARLESGKTLVVSNVGILCEGFDSPPVSCIVLARPTQSVGLFLQMCGRALRPYPGKTDVVILDHSRAHHQHGFVDDEREWSLDPNPTAKKATDRTQSIATCKSSFMNCPCGKPGVADPGPGEHDLSNTHHSCYATFRAGPDACPYCRCPILRKARKIETVNGELRELQRPVSWRACCAQMNLPFMPEQAVAMDILEKRGMVFLKDFGVLNSTALVAKLGVHPDSLAARVAGEFAAVVPAPVTPEKAARMFRRDFEFLLAKARREGKRDGWARHVFTAKTGMEVPGEWMR